jgi:hypothetical protein
MGGADFAPAEQSVERHVELDGGGNREPHLTTRRTRFDVDVAHYYSGSVLLGGPIPNSRSTFAVVARRASDRGYWIAIHLRLRSGAHGSGHKAILKVPD